MVTLIDGVLQFLFDAIISCNAQGCADDVVYLSREGSLLRKPMFLPLGSRVFKMIHCAGKLSSFFT